jgi:FAR1 DNA-binding domain
MGITTDQKTPEREHGSTRTGCKAYLRIKVLKTGIWQVSVFNEEHNHPLILSPSKIKIFDPKRRFLLKIGN